LWISGSSTLAESKGVGNFAQGGGGWVGFRIPTDPSDTTYAYGGIQIENLDFSGDPGGSVTVDQVQYDTGNAAVPEPSTFALLALGVAGVAALRRRRKV
jgi:hypothetical protein